MICCLAFTEGNSCDFHCKNWDFAKETLGNARVKLKNFKKRGTAGFAEPKAQTEKKQKILAVLA